MRGHILRRLRPGLAWAAVLGLLFLAWHLKHPLTYWLRPCETPLLLGLGMSGGLWLRPGKARPAYRLLAIALLGVAGLTLYRQQEFIEQRAEVLAATADMRLLGSHFIVGFEHFAELEPLAAHGLIGGIYLTRRNVRHSSPAEVTGQIARLQALRRQAGLPPLIVAADQEGGSVAHLSPMLANLPPLASLLERDSGSLHERARRYGEEQGAGLARLGINLNFGPVVDLRPDTPIRDDKLTNIGARAISDDPLLVSEVADGYIAGLTSSGVRATLKHFPGLGRVRQDTHLKAARLAETPSALAADWQPFRALGGQPATTIMLGHVTLERIDPAHAASHSAAVVTGLLRRDWGYDGILITDDLNMGAVYQHGIGRVAGEALAAGVDLVLVSYDPEQYYRALYGAAQALQRGEIPRGRLHASQWRLEQFAGAGPTSRQAGATGNSGDKIAAPVSYPLHDAPADSRPVAGKPALARQLRRRRQC
jgi:beta-N-acetylhexosaminidase